MSYILDALKKSEQERARHIVSSGSEALPERPSAQAVKWRGPMVGLAVVVALAAVLVLGRQDHDLLKANDAPVRAPDIARYVPPDSVEPAPERPADQSADGAVDQQQAIRERNEPFTLMTLPAEVRENLPAISIEGHIFDQEPGERMVIINGSIRHEGQQVTQALKLTEILPDGVHFSFRNHDFIMRTFEVWPSP